MSQSETDLLLGYWRSLKPSEAEAPKRSQFDPAQLKPIVPSMLMISDRENGFRFRLGGGKLVEWHGRDLKGIALSELFLNSQQASLRVLLSLSARQNKPLLLSLESGFNGGQRVHIQLALAPLRNQAGVIDRYVGVYSPRSPLKPLLNQRLERFVIIGSSLIDHESLPYFQAETKEKRGPELKLIVLNGRRIA